MGIKTYIGDESQTSYGNGNGYGNGYGNGRGSGYGTMW